MKPRRILTLIGIFLLVLLVGGLVFFGSDYLKNKKELDALKKNPQETAKVEAKALVAKMGQHIILPTDEEPTVATISDTTQLANQPFFANAKNGDKVVIYAKAKKVYLYDPKADLILEVAPLNITASPTPTPNE